MKSVFTILILAGAVLQSTAQRIDVNNVKQHVYYLASDELKGRAPGTGGEKKAAAYIAKYYEQYKLQPKGTEGYYQSFDYKMTRNPHDSVATGKTYHGRNVIGFLDNGKPYTMVIGAHYDHLGIGDRGSSLDKEPKGKVHNGADDNASGTAGVLELARYFSTNGKTEDVNFLFMCFSAEEAGLIGSKYFVNHPTIGLDKMHSMMNMDMIGRLVDSTNKLLVYGIGTSDVFVDGLNSANKYGFVLVMDSSGIGPSDQTSFYLKKIPVLHFFTGQHTDYHKPGDDADKVNYPGEVKVLEYMVDVIEGLSNYEKPKYYETQTKDMGAKSSFKVTLGVMPDYGYQGKGLRIDAVNKDKPAEKAGLKAGDVVEQIGDIKVENIYDYMKALSKFEKGQTTMVVVKRGSETIKANLTF